MNAKKLLATLLSAVMAVTALASCGEGTNYSNEAVKAANEAQSTVVFETDSDLAKSLQDALEDYTQTSDIKTAMVADENLKDLLTSGYQLDVYAAQGEDAEAAAQAIAQQYIVNIVSGKQSEGKIAMILHKGNGYYYAAVLTYRTGGGSGSGGSGGSSSGDDGEDNKPVSYSITVEIEGNGTATAPSTVKAGESCTITTTPAAHHKVTDVTAVDKNGKNVTISSSNNQYTIDKVNSDITVTVKFEKCAVTGIAVKENPDRMIYEDGDAFEPDGMVITVTYEDGSTEDITTGYEYETDALTPDNNEVTITYEDQETTLKVTVNKKQYVVSVTKKGEGGDVTPLGDAFVTAGEDFEFSVTLNDKVKYKVDSITIERREGYTETLALSNDNKYTVTKVESDVNVVVTFAERKLMRLDVTGIHDTYTVGDKIDLENVTVTAVYEGNVRADLSSNDYTITPITFNKDGTVEVKVKYEDVEWTKEVTVKPNTYTVTVELEGNHGTVTPGNKIVEVGKDATFNVAPYVGWKVSDATATNNQSVTVSNNTVTVSNVQSDTTVTLKFTELPVQKIEVDSSSSFKTDYTCYDKLNLSGLKLKVTYENGTKTIDVDESNVDIRHVNQDKWTWIGGINFKKTENKYNTSGYWEAQFNITYGGKTAQIKVHVTCGEDMWLTRQCSYCPDWDGDKNIAPKWSAKAAHFTETEG